MDPVTRRLFLEESMLAATAALGAGPVLGAEKPPRGPNEKIRAAATGVRGRGRTLGLELVKFGCEVTHVCDADSAIGRRAVKKIAERQGGREPVFVQDIRRVFDDKSIDVVSSATPNHWHALAAIWAMQSGKDVYIEKPVSHNVSEGRRMAQAARKLGRICQAGTQRRSVGAIREAARFMQEGKLGKVTLARCIVYRPRKSIGPVCEGKVPPTVDYNLWAGPAPMAPVTRQSFHYDWHWLWDYGCGELGNNGIHVVDVARLGLGVTGLGQAILSYGGRFAWDDAGETPNTQVTIHDFGDKTIVQEVRNLPTRGYRKPGGVIFEGTEGYICSSGGGATLFDPKGKRIKAFGGQNEHHMANFLKAVRSGNPKDLNAEILEGHQSTALCHVGNISYRVGQPASPADIVKALEALKGHEARLETFERVRQHLAANQIDIAKTPLTLGRLLKIDSEHERFVGCPEADAFLTRDYRKPFVVPAASEI